MNSRFAVLAVVAVLALAGVAVGGAAAEHDEPVEEDEIAEVQTVGPSSDTGEVTVDYSYHIGGEVAGLEVTLPETVEVTGLHGFDPADEPRTYRWDEQTAEPTIETTYAVNETGSGGLTSVDTAEWTMVAAPNERLTAVGYRVQPGTDVSVDYRTTVEGSGDAGENMVYLGEFEQRTVGDATVVISDAAEVDESTIETVGRALADSTAALDSDDEVTLFVAAEPLRSGGLAIGDDFWVRDEVLPPAVTLWHEFTHTQQEYDPTADSEWSIEGGADYLGALLALRQGEIQYDEFRNRLAVGNTHDVSLADSDTWEGTRANYELGALVLAALDREMRDGSGSYEALLQAKNGKERVSDAEFEALAGDVAGTDLSEFFDTHVRSPPPEIDVPLPTIYDAGNDDAAVSLTAANLTTSEDPAPVTVELGNGGTETALAPTLTLAPSDGATVSVRSDSVTEVDDRLVFDHLGPGESVETTVLVGHGGENASLSLTVEDMSGNSDAAETSVTVVAGDSEAGDDEVADDDSTADTGDDETQASASTDDGESGDDDGAGFGIVAVAGALAGLALLARRWQPQEN